jgi:hypothetical protein
LVTREAAGVKRPSSLTHQHKCWATNVGCAASSITPLLMVPPPPVQSQQLPQNGALPTEHWRCRCASLAHLCAACSSICTSYSNITKQQKIIHMHSPPPSPGVLAPPRRCLRSSLAIRFPLSKRTVHRRAAATAAVLVSRDAQAGRAASHEIACTKGRTTVAAPIHCTTTATAAAPLSNYADIHH